MSLASYFQNNLLNSFLFQSIGAWLTLSTMAAAALGNTVSDAAGVGLTHYVEFLVSRFGIKHPVLNSEQVHCKNLFKRS